VYDADLLGRKKLVPNLVEAGHGDGNLCLVQRPVEIDGSGTTSCPAFDAAPPMPTDATLRLKERAAVNPIGPKPTPRGMPRALSKPLDGPTRV
jgi:hypothetical protein